MGGTWAGQGKLPVPRAPAPFLVVRKTSARARIDPAAFGFMNVTTPCIGLPSCEGYVFWDGLHPTTAAHARLAEAALSALQKRQQPLTQPLP